MLPVCMTPYEAAPEQKYLDGVSLVRSPGRGSMGGNHGLRHVLGLPSTHCVVAEREDKARSTS